MAEQAQVTSIEAVEAFRAALIVYLSQMRPVLEEAGRDGMRTQLWLENDRRRFWQTELRKRHRQLEEARLELFNVTLSKLQEASQLHQFAVQKAQRGVEEAEAKLHVIKNWERELEDRTAPLVKMIEQLHGFLTTDMSKAVAHLDQIIYTLTAYRETGASGNSESANQFISVAEKIEPEGGK
jgi:hypothetical protein